MRRKVNAYGPVVLAAIRVGAKATRVPTTRGLIFYGYYEYTGWSGFWRKAWLGIQHRINEHRNRR